MMYIIIILLTLFILYLIRDIGKLLRINSIIYIISGYLLLIVNIIINYIVRYKVNFMGKYINNVIGNTIINWGLILILGGAIQLIIYVIVSIYNKRRISK